MEFREVVRRRRMVRSFESTPVPEEVLDRILDVARRGPSAGFSQGTEFLVLSGEETNAYWDASLPANARDAFGLPGLLRAPVLVLVLANKDAYLDRYAEPDKGWTDRDESRWPVPYWDIDAGMAALLILLASVDEGLGALLFGVYGDWEAIRAGLEIPDGFRCVGVVALGTPTADDQPIGSAVSRPRRALDDVVHRGTW